jgi:Peptidase_C39 like family
MSVGTGPSPIGNSGLGANNISLYPTEEEVPPEVADPSANIANTSNTGTTTAFSGTDYNSTLNVSPSTVNPLANNNTLVAQNNAANPPSTRGQDLIDAGLAGMSGAGAGLAAMSRGGYVEPPRTTRATNEIPNLRTYRENAGPWQNDKYNGDIREVDNPTLGRYGCTNTAISNASSVSGANVTPSDINERNENWFNARDRTNWNNLMNPANSGPNRLGYPERPINIRQPNNGQLTPEMRGLLGKIDQQVSAGHPVVLGMTGQRNPDGSNGPRHSVLVTGIDRTKPVGDLSRYIVRDNYLGNRSANDPEALRTTLAASLKNYGPPYTQIDMAVAASKK